MKTEKQEFQAREVKRRAFTVAEVAETLGVSKTSTYRLIQRGFFKPIRVLRHLLVPVEQIDLFLQSSTGKEVGI